MIQNLLGIGAQNINWYQAAVRAVVVYLSTLAMMRIGEKRFLGKHTAFDVVVGVILGSMVANVITNEKDVAPTLVAGFVLVGMHWLFALITFKSDFLDTFFKGTSHRLIQNGQVLWDAMRKNTVTQEDLIQQVRIVEHTETLDKIKEAYFERSGDISFIEYEHPPRVVEVRVEKGVQTVRIVLDS